MLVCTHHVTKHASANRNGRPDLTKGPPAVPSARIGRSTAPRASPSERETEILAPDSQLEDAKPDDDSLAVPAVSPNGADGEKEEAPRPSSPPNPFDESDEGEKEENDSNPTANCLPPTPAGLHQGTSRPVPAPRRVSEPTPPPRPAPRVRMLRGADGQWLLHF